VRIKIETGEIKEEQAGVELGKLDVKNMEVFGEDGAGLL
jgi:hypothetical protein